MLPTLTNHHLQELEILNRDQIYTLADLELKEQIKTTYVELSQSMNESLALTIEWGNLLIDLKRRTIYGNWEKAVKDMGYSTRTTAHAMQVAKAYNGMPINMQQIANLSAKAVLRFGKEKKVEKKPKKPSKKRLNGHIIDSGDRPLLIAYNLLEPLKRVVEHDLKRKVALAVIKQLIEQFDFISQDVF